MGRHHPIHGGPLQNKNVQQGTFELWCYLFSGFRIWTGTYTLRSPGSQAFRHKLELHYWLSLAYILQMADDCMSQALLNLYPLFFFFFFLFLWRTLTTALPLKATCYLHLFLFLVALPLFFLECGDAGWSSGCHLERRVKHHTLGMTETWGFQSFVELPYQPWTAL